MLPRFARVLLAAIVVGAHGEWASMYKWPTDANIPSGLGTCISANDDFTRATACWRSLPNSGSPGEEHWRGRWSVKGDIDHEGAEVMRPQQDGGVVGESFSGFYRHGGVPQFWYRTETNWHDANSQMAGDGNSMIIQERGDHTGPDGANPCRFKVYWYMENYMGRDDPDSDGKMWWTDSEGVSRDSNFEGCKLHTRVGFKIEHSHRFICYACAGTTTGIGRCMYMPDADRSYIGRHSRGNIGRSYVDRHGGSIERGDQHDFETSGSNPTTFDMTKDGSMMAAGGDTNGIDIFARSLTDGAVSLKQTLDPLGRQGKSGESLKFSDDGSRLVVSCRECSSNNRGAIYTFDLNGAQSYELKHVLEGEDDDMNLGAAGFDGSDPGYGGLDMDGVGMTLCTTEATPDNRGKVRTWDWTGDAWQETIVLEGSTDSRVSKCLLSKDGKRLITASPNAPGAGEVQIFELAATTTKTTVTATATDTTATATTATETTATLTTTQMLFVDAAHRVYSSVVMASCGIMYLVTM